MHYTIRTLLNQGRSIRQIAQTLQLNRRTVKKVSDRLKSQQGAVQTPERKLKPSRLDAHTDQIGEWLSEGLNASNIRQRLCAEKSEQISVSAVQRFIRSRFAHTPEVYIPVHSDAGQEAQVDFGYLGYFERDGKKVKTWIFCMVLSHSRYAYYREVTDQSIPTFLRCHMEAFEYFGGVPATVKIDNLRAGVLQADFYEPSIQHQYARMLAHYGAAPITARIRRGQDKGKVEAGIKYVKNNFLKVLTHRDYSRMSGELERWNRDTCNRRTHGTTRKVPADVFKQTEQQVLLPLPQERYEVCEIGHRKVNTLGHIFYGYNYYSVPHTLVGKTVRTESNGRLLRIYADGDGSSAAGLPVATHILMGGKGQFITLDAHKPPQKRDKSDEHYMELLAACGPSAKALAEQMREQKPRHWKDMSRGLLQLAKRYGKDITDAACARALAYGAYSFQSVKRICEEGLYREEAPAQEPSTITNTAGGYGHDLAIYDQLFEP